MQEDVAEIEARIRRDPRLRREWIRQDNLVYGGLIAGSVAIVQPFLTATTTDLSATIAVVSFSVAIPLLAALLMVNQQEALRGRPAGLRLIDITKVVGQGLAVLGVTAAFWHVTWIAGVAIVVSGLVAVVIHATAYTRIEGLDTPSGAA
jgi:cobalamin synthase